MGHACLIGWLSLGPGPGHGACRLVTPTPPDARREALPVRMAMIEVERALEHVASAAEAASGPAAAALPAGKAAAGVAAEAEATTEGLEHQGLFAYRLAVVGCRLIQLPPHVAAWACSVLRVSSS